MLRTFQMTLDYFDIDSSFNVEGQASTLQIDPMSWYRVNGVHSGGGGVFIHMKASNILLLKR